MAAARLKLLLMATGLAGCNNSFILVQGSDDKQSSRTCEDKACLVEKNSPTVDDTKPKTKSNEPTRFKLTASSFRDFHAVSGSGTEADPYQLVVLQNEDDGKISFSIASSLGKEASVSCVDNPHWVSFDSFESSLSISSDYSGIKSPAVFRCTARCEGYASSLFFHARVEGVDRIELMGLNGQKIGSQISAIDLNADGATDLGFKYTFAGTARFQVLFSSRDRNFANSSTIGELDADRRLIIYGNSHIHFGGQVDANNDGVYDLLFYRNEINCLNSGKTWIVYGKPGPWPTSINVETELNGDNGFRLQGSGCKSWYFADVDGDSHVDAFHSWRTGNGVIFGDGSAWPTVLSDSDAHTSIVDDLGSATFGDRSTVGDIDGQPGVELIINAYNASAYYVFKGGSAVWGTTGSRPASVTTSSLDGTNGTRISGFGNYATGNPVIMDINNDEIGDLVFPTGALVSTGGEAGATYGFFGRSTPWLASYSSVSANSLIAFEGHWGMSHRDPVQIYPSVDANGDGINDLCVRGTSSERVYCLYGMASYLSSRYRTTDLDGTNGFILNTGANALRLATDVNGDSKTDFLLGYPTDNLGGAVYLLYGQSSFATEAPAFKDLPTELGASFTQESLAGEYFGTGIEVLDFDLDGYLDLAVTAPESDYGAETDAGRVYILFGSSTGWTDKIL